MKIEFTAKIELLRPLNLQETLKALGHIHRISRGQGVSEDSVKVKTHEGWKTNEGPEHPAYVEAEWTLDTEDGQ